MNSITTYRMKPKAFTVLLRAEDGSTKFVDVIGCADLEECIEYIKKTQEKGYEIKIIKEKKQNIKK